MAEEWPSWAEWSARGPPKNGQHVPPILHSRQPSSECRTPRWRWSRQTAVQHKGRWRPQQRARVDRICAATLFQRRWWGFSCDPLLRQDLSFCVSVCVCVRAAWPLYSPPCWPSSPRSRSSFLYPDVRRMVEPPEVEDWLQPFFVSEKEEGFTWRGFEKRAVVVVVVVICLVSFFGWFTTYSSGWQRDEEKMKT